MKGTKNTVELSLLGLEKMLKQDINEAIVEGKKYVLILVVMDYSLVLDPIRRH